MRASKPLTITLTERLAKSVKARVARGDYASESEVIRDGLRALEEREARQQAELDHWLRAEIAPRLKALDKGAAKTIPLDEGFARVRKRSAKK